MITECQKPYHHEPIIDDAARLSDLQVTVLDVGCQHAGGTTVGGRGHHQPLRGQGLGQQLGLHLETQTHREDFAFSLNSIWKVGHERCDHSFDLQYMIKVVTWQTKLQKLK